MVVPELPQSSGISQRLKQPFEFIFSVLSSINSIFTPSDLQTSREESGSFPAEKLFMQA